MKSTIHFLFVLFVMNISYGQIIYEHTFTNQGSLTNPSSFNGDVIYTQTGMKYVTYNKTTTSATSTSTEVKIYDLNYILIKTIVCPNLISVYYITDKLFNSDDDIEIAYLANRWFAYPNGGGVYTYDVVIRDENSNVLLQCSDRMGAKLFKTENGDYRFIVHTYTTNTPYYYNTAINFNDGTGFVTAPYNYDVYRIVGGLLSTNQEQLYLKGGLVGHPIPTQDTLNITNNLSQGESARVEVFTMNGEKVLEKEVIGNNQEISIDVSGLSSGVYIYKLNGETLKFIKE